MKWDEVFIFLNKVQCQSLHKNMKISIAKAYLNKDDHQKLHFEKYFFLSFKQPNLDQEEQFIEQIYRFFTPKTIGIPFSIDEHMRISHIFRIYIFSKGAYGGNPLFSTSTCIVLILIFMQVMQYEENCEEDHQLDVQLQEFAKKTMVFRFIEQLNKKHQNGPTCQDSHNKAPQKMLIKQSSQIRQKSLFPFNRHHLSLDQSLINKVNQQLSIPQPSSLKKTARKKLMIEKKLKKGDLLNGNGVARLPKGEAIFATWKNGTACGQVKIVYPSGGVYIGKVKNYVLHGLGVFLFKNGNIYEGEFKDGKIEGYGVHADSARVAISKGIWKKGTLVQATQ